MPRQKSTISLGQFHEDYASLRRCLVDEGLLTRTAGVSPTHVDGWEISANLGRHEREAALTPVGGCGRSDAVTRIARVVIEISREQLGRVTREALPEDTRQALATDGRTELLSVLGDEDPPP